MSAWGGCSNGGGATVLDFFFCVVVSGFPGPASRGGGGGDDGLVYTGGGSGTALRRQFGSGGATIGGYARPGIVNPGASVIGGTYTRNCLSWMMICCELAAVDSPATNANVAIIFFIPVLPSGITNAKPNRT